MHFSDTCPLINCQNVKLRFTHGFHGSNGLFHVLTRRNVRSREVSKPWDLYVELSDRSKIWQPPRQHCCRCACQISKWSFKLPISRLRDFTRSYSETSYQILKRCPGQDSDSIPIRFRQLTGGWFPLKSANSSSTGTRHSVEKSNASD